MNVSSMSADVEARGARCARPRSARRVLAHGAAVWLMLMCASGSSTSGGDDRVQEIVQNVAANERLYDDLELVIEERYRWIGPKDLGAYPTGIVIASLDAEARYVYQNGLVYHHRQRQQATSPDTDPMKLGREYMRTHGRDEAGVLRRESSYTLGYDGERTVCVDQAANIHQGRYVPRQLVRPHSLIFLHEPHLMRPLSEYLTAPRLDKEDHGHEVAYEGEAVVDGLQCVRLRSNIIFRKGEDPDFMLLWLAVERNYLPVKMEFYMVNYSRAIPLAVSTVSDWRELSPGVWCPLGQSRIKNDEQSAAKGRTIAVVRSDNQVTKAELDPHHDISLFRDIRIPEGMPVTVLKEERPVEDYVQGHAPSAGRWSWWWVAAAVLACVLVGLWRRDRIKQMLR